MTNVPEIGKGPQGPKSLLDQMKSAPRWLLQKDKVPYYISGKLRSGALDSPEDRSKLVTYLEALDAYEKSPGKYSGLGFALGPDGNGGYWQGIDVDKIIANELSDIAEHFRKGALQGFGYFELSPSRMGVHLIGYGRRFNALGSNGTGIEAYCGGRYFTVTGDEVRLADGTPSPHLPIDLADTVENYLAPRHSKKNSPPPSNEAPPLPSPSGNVITVDLTPPSTDSRVDQRQVAELRSALNHMRSDDRGLWIKMGMALHELGNTGRGLWLDWSQSSEKYEANDAAKTWASFKPTNTGYKAVFAEAQSQGWVNPASKDAQLPAVQTAPPPSPQSMLLSPPPSITLELARATDTATATLHYLLDPYLPAGCVVGFYGRGSTAKSSFVASISAHISECASTLWVSAEEPKDWIKARHIKSGGADGTLAIVVAVPHKKDSQGRVIASSFNIFDHLGLAINKAQEEFAINNSPPLRLVVLDTAVGLTTWAKNESPNDDAAVKKLLGHLQAIAEAGKLTIAIIGHANKGVHEHFADSVMGATAWTNSPRLSFMHASDLREEHAYVIVVAKTNLVTFGASYRTEPVHVLYERKGGPDSVLVKVVPGETLWGEAKSMKLFRDATQKPKQQTEREDEGARLFIGTIEKALLEAESVTRQEVEELRGDVVDRRWWTWIDEQLKGHPTIVMKRGPKNRREYWRRGSEGALAPVVPTNPIPKTGTTGTTE